MKKAENIRTKIDWLYVSAVFLLGSLLGWVWETLFFAIRMGNFVNRGFLFGPWLPIYGVGCVFIYLLKKLFKNNLFLLFSVSALVCAIIEYGTSWILEKVYHKRWWSYEGLPFNLHGRIYLGGIFAFSYVGCLVAFILFPYYEKLLDKIPRRTLWIANVLIIACICLDFGITLFRMHSGQ